MTYICLHCQKTLENTRKNYLSSKMGFPDFADGKEIAYAGDLDSIPALGRSSGEGNGDPLHYSCLENLMFRRAWQDLRVANNST